MSAVQRIRHAGVALALHDLRPGNGDPLLLLHELSGTSVGWDVERDVWPGHLLALDFAGHGASEWRAGGAYTPELLAGDVDAALATLGSCRIAGAGLGAYVALVVAGARPDLVPAALLLPGRGLDGGGPVPDFARTSGLAAELAEIETARADGTARYDPMVRSCARDVRPPDYAVSFARAARCLLLAEDGGPRPPWWEALRETTAASSVAADPRRALERLWRSDGA